MGPRALVGWRWRRAGLAVLGLAGWAMVWLVLLLVFAYSRSVSLVHVLGAAGGIATVLLCAAGRFPGARAPFIGSACRICREDLASFLPGDGVSVRCPECGHTNRLAASMCGACRYDLSGVPAADGVKTCPECGHRVLVVGSAAG